MQILKKQRVPVAYKYVYLAALIFSLVVLLQTGRTNAVGEVNLLLYHVVLVFLNYFVWALLVDWVYGIGLSVDRIPSHPAKSILEILVGLIIMVVIHLVISNFLYYVFMFLVYDFNVQRIIDTLSDIYIRALLSRGVDLIVILSLLKVINTYQTLQHEKLRVSELENQLHLSQLDALKAQLNPHFLFNTLHALQTLIGHDNIKAKSMLIKVSGLLRKILDQRDKHIITFEEELSYLKDYLEIEQERFYDRLTIQFDIQDETKKMNVLSLMLQPLAENAIKHGISKVEHNGVIALSARITENQFELKMSNTMPVEYHAEGTVSTELGLINLKSRLEQLYDENFSLTTKKSNGLFVVSILIDLDCLKNY